MWQKLWGWLGRLVVQPDPWDDPVDVVAEEDAGPRLPPSASRALGVYRLDAVAAEWALLVDHAADLPDAAARARRLGPGLYVLRTAWGLEVGSVRVRPARRADAATRRAAAAAWN